MPPPPAVAVSAPPAPATAATADVPQYGRRWILGVWAVAALPMGALAWIVAPALASSLSGPTALARALPICLTVGLVWQFMLVLILVRREQGSLSWSVLKDALWLRAPRNPKNGRRGGRMWLIVIPLIILYAVQEFLPKLPIPATRDIGPFLQSDQGMSLLSGNWAFFLLLAAMFIFNTALGEELLFRGLLLPRMQAAFGQRAWLANGVLFAVYHLHVPWSIPATLAIDTFAAVYPAQRYRSALIGIVVHSSQTVFFLIATLMLVLR